MVYARIVVKYVSLYTYIKYINTLKEYINISGVLPMRKDTGVFERFGRFIGLKCHNYALCLCYIYMYMYITQNS